MANRILAYIGLGIALLFLVGTLAMGGGSRVTGRSVTITGNMEDHHGESEQPVKLSGEELAKYRSEDIPADCRLPDYDDDVDKWKEHLSHHKDTEYCLDYYK